jgi:regulator of sigma E protease
VESLIEGMPVEAAGLQAGDVITAVNGVEIPTGKDYDAYLEEHPLSEGEAVELTYERDGSEYRVSVVPQTYTSVSLGFQSNYTRTKGNILQILGYSALEVKYWIRTTILSLKELILGKYGLNDLSGPVGVVSAIGTAYESSKSEGTLWVWMNMLNMAILLSANLGVMNLLPIPALDGGRLVFLIVEAIRRKPANRQVEGMIHFAGLVLLMLLMVVVMYNDILKLFV